MVTGGLALGLLTGCGGESAEGLTVTVDAPLVDAFTEIAAYFEDVHRDVDVRIEALAGDADPDAVVDGASVVAVDEPTMTALGDRVEEPSRIATGPGADGTTTRYLIAVTEAGASSDDAAMFRGMVLGETGAQVLEQFGFGSANA